MRTNDGGTRDIYVCRKSKHPIRVGIYQKQIVDIKIIAINENVRCALISTLNVYHN